MKKKWLPPCSFWISGQMIGSYALGSVAGFGFSSPLVALLFDVTAVVAWGLWCISRSGEAKR